MYFLTFTTSKWSQTYSGRLKKSGQIFIYKYNYLFFKFKSLDLGCRNFIQFILYSFTRLIRFQPPSVKWTHLQLLDGGPTRFLQMCAEGRCHGSKYSALYLVFHSFCAFQHNFLDIFLSFLRKRKFTLTNPFWCLFTSQCRDTVMCISQGNPFYCRWGRKMATRNYPNEFTLSHTT